MAANEPVHEVKEIALAAIDLDDTTFCFRMSIKVDGLAQDIKANGQDFPVVIRKLGGKLQLVCGFRRCTALRNIGRNTVIAVVKELTDDEAYRLAWSENEARKSYTDLDRAHAILKANQAGKTMKELEKVFGKTRKQLTRWKMLAKLPTAVKEALADGTISTTHAVVLHEMKVRYPGLDFSTWIKAVGEGGLSVQQLRNRITRAHAEERKVEPLVVEKDGVLQFKVRKLYVEKMSDEERAAVVQQLEAALALLKA